jgi:Zinc finger, C3HC4 type (RING finger)
MDTVAIQCNICLNKAQVNNLASGEHFYVSPLVTLVNCGHHLCTNCVKRLSLKTIEPSRLGLSPTVKSMPTITCPSCRKVESRIRFATVTDDIVHFVEANIKNIKVYPTQSTPLNLSETMNQIFNNNVIDDSDNEHVIDAVIEISRLHADIEALHERHANALDLAEQLESNVATLRAEKTAFELCTKAKLAKFNALKRKHDTMELKLRANIKQNINFKRQNTFLTQVNNKLRTENAMSSKRTMETRAFVDNIVDNKITEIIDLSEQIDSENEKFVNNNVDDDDDDDDDDYIILRKIKKIM